MIDGDAVFVAAVRRGDIARSGESCGII